MSLEPGRAAAIPASHRAPRGRRRPDPGRPAAIQAVLAGGAIRAGQILGDVTPVGAAATPAREMRAVTGGIRDSPPPGAAAIQDPARRPVGCLLQRGSGGMGPPGPGGFRGVVPPGQHSPAALMNRAIPAGGGILLDRGVRDSGARCRAASGSASSSPARPSVPSSLW
jgi:hypothetical protein